LLNLADNGGRRPVTRRLQVMSMTALFGLAKLAIAPGMAVLLGENRGISILASITKHSTTISPVRGTLERGVREITDLL